MMLEVDCYQISIDIYIHNTFIQFRIEFCVEQIECLQERYYLYFYSLIDQTLSIVYNVERFITQQKRKKKQKTKFILENTYILFKTYHLQFNWLFYG